MKFFTGKRFKASILVMAFTLGVSSLSGVALADVESNEQPEVEYNGLTTEEIDAIILAPDEDIVLTEEEERTADELAANLEFIVENAIVNENGVETFDFDVIYEEFGEDPEIKEFEENLVVSTVVTAPKGMQRANAVDRCVTNKIKSNFKATFSVQAMSTIVDLVRDKNYKKAAGKIAKVVAKGNVQAISLSLVYFLLSCEYKHNGW